MAIFTVIKRKRQYTTKKCDYMCQYISPVAGEGGGKRQKSSMSKLLLHLLNMLGWHILSGQYTILIIHRKKVHVYIPVKSLNILDFYLRQFFGSFLQDFITLISNQCTPIPKLLTDNFLRMYYIQLSIRVSVTGKAFYGIMLLRSRLDTSEASIRN